MRIARILFVCITLAGTIAGVTLYRTILNSLHQPFRLHAPLLVEIPRGAGTSSIATMLEREGLVVERRWFEIYVRALGLAHRIQAGTYEILPNESLVQALAKFITGQVKTFSITIVEGTLFSVMRDDIARLPYITHTLRGVSDLDLMQRLGAGNHSPEGWFFPATYTYPAHASDFSLFKRAHERMRQELERAWQRRAPELPFDAPYDALILASIVEKEAARSEERAQIAGVFVRRLRLGMKLQTDPSVIYGLAERYDGNLRRSDLERDTPFNTYTRAGLPPTPIALPGAAALAAAVAPTADDALYFVARGDGSHEFSASLDAHNRAVRRYQVRRTQ